ncbi:MAG: hypothetical protein Fur0022_03350 [Anaerolineales bacterium]
MSRNLFLCLFVCVFALFIPARTSGAPLLTPVFINEIHYDNTGTDTGEAIEVAGPAGTNLSGWSLVLYNGSGGAVYYTEALSGVLPDLCQGYGMITFPIAGIQNGSPDGIALVNNTTVIQFLSYEGSFTAVGGVADGMVSTDIMVFEDGTEPIGQSLQLQGTGTDYEDFTWTGPIANTDDDCNTGQTFTGSGDVAPFVTSTAPLDTETNIPVDFNIDIVFSEAVTVHPAWFDITCTVSGNHTAIVTGGPTDYTLNPDTDFDSRETCTVTIYASQVEDQDLPADPMPDDYTFTFSTGGWIINEIHPNPDPVFGDANGDGVVHTTNDEFVEIINNTGSAIDVSGWIVNDGTLLARHTFPSGTIVPDTCAVVIFGGGTPTGAFGNALVQIASSGTLGLNNTGDTIRLDTGSLSQVTTSYADGSLTISLTRDPDITGPDPLVQHDTATGSGGALFSPGTQINGTPFSDCAIPIHTLQGSGSTSAYTSNTVTISGIVVGDFQSTSTGLSGFYVQEEDSDADANPATSEGIFVYDNGFGTDVAVGDLVEVTGTVIEYTSGTSSLTEISTVTDVTIISSGNALPSAASVTLPVTALTDLERYEGMRVSFAQTLYVTEHYELGRYGQIFLSSGDRLSQPTHVAAPGAPALAVQAANDLNRIVLDDASTVQNPDPIIHPAPGLSASNTLRGGDTVTGLAGVLDHRFSYYRVQPTGPITFTSTNARPPAPDDVNGSLTVASFNVLNYFSTIDTGAFICGPLADQECRGADSAQELTRQRNKLFNALATLDADIVGLIEIENHATDDALDDLVTRLNTVVGAGTYAKINTGVIGTDAIKVALIYKPATVTPSGAYAILDDTFNPNFHDDLNRPSLAQTFTQNLTGEAFTIIVNHFKSKGSACTGDPDTGDGQGNCNQTRTDAATVLLNWITTDPTGSGDPDFLLIGDLNSYAQEDPITTLTTGGFTNLIASFLGASAYSYVFDGQWGYLDYALADPDLLPQISGLTEWHINADEPLALDYNTEYKSAGQLTSLYNTDPYRTSDHDPVLVGLYAFDFSDLAASYGYAWHDGGGALRLGTSWNASSDVGNGDDDSSDDGVVRAGLWTAGNPATINVTTNGPGYLAAWFDWDESGVFETDEKMIFQEILGAGVHPIVITVDPTFLPSMTLQTRFRFYAAEPTTLSPTGTESPTGAGTGGEVEDYNWTFSPTAITLQTFTATQAGWGLPFGVGMLIFFGLIGLFLKGKRAISPK